MNKKIFIALVAIVVVALTLAFTSEPHEQHTKNTSLSYEADSLDHVMAASMCDAKKWSGVVCPALLTLSQDLDAGVFARYPSTEARASQEVNRLVLRVIAMDSLETNQRLRDALSLEQ